MHVRTPAEERLHALFDHDPVDAADCPTPSLRLALAGAALCLIVLLAVVML